MNNAPLRSTLSKKKKQHSTKEQRLEALLLAEEQERKELASHYANAYQKGHHEKNFASAIFHNPYYRYWQSAEGEVEIAKQLLPSDFRSSKNTNKKSQSNLQSQHQQILEGRREEEKKSMAQKASMTVPLSGSASPPHQPANTGSVVQSTTRNNKALAKASIDIATLKPECAEIYVKFEKLHRMMKREDQEFIKFRKDYLQRERVRKLDV